MTGVPVAEPVEVAADEESIENGLRKAWNIQQILKISR